MTLVWSALLVAAVALTTSTERLLDARNRAYDATFRNDATALRQAAADLDKLVADSELARMALYYAAWADWSLAMSEMQAEKTSEAIAAVERSVARARRALQLQSDDPEVLMLLANGLVMQAILDRAKFDAVLKEVDLRRKGLALSPQNPRVVMFDAGWMFNTPSEVGGSRERALARLLEAIELLKREAASVKPDDTRPTWGLPLAYGSLAVYYLAMTPPQHEKARAAADTALMMRPDFWYVNERVLPRLTK